MPQVPHPLGRRLVAEALGTAILVATVVGSGIMAERLAGGNQAIALLGNTIPTGAILVVIITILGPISGAHFNPAVTLVFAGRGEFPWNDVTPYIVVQCLGGVCGTMIAHAMFDLAPLAIGTTTRSGPSQWFAEAVATFTLVLTILGGVLVHVVDVLRQSGGDIGSGLYDDVCRHRDQPRSRLHRRPVGWSGDGGGAVHDALFDKQRALRKSCRPRRVGTPNRASRPITIPDIVAGNATPYECAVP
jgi:hypothetical protein